MLFLKNSFIAHENEFLKNLFGDFVKGRKALFHKLSAVVIKQGFPGVTVVKNTPTNAGHARDSGSIPGLGRSPGTGNGDSFQYSCLENPTCTVGGIQDGTATLENNLGVLLSLFSHPVRSDSVTPWTAWSSCTPGLPVPHHLPEFAQVHVH